MTGYSSTPLLQKLGIKSGMKGMFVNIPSELYGLVSEAKFQSLAETTGKMDYVHIFVHKESELMMQFETAKAILSPTGSLWISWPKAGKLGTDLTENRIRDVGLSIGLVDVKVVAIDETWSGLKFVYRLKDR